MVRLENDAFPKFKKTTLFHSMSLMEARPRSCSPVSDHGIYSMPSSPNCNTKTKESLFDFSKACQTLTELNLDEGYEGEAVPTVCPDFNEECDPAAMLDTQGFLDSTIKSQPVDLATSQNMHHIWHGQFNRCFGEFSKFGDRWELIPTLESPPAKSNLYFYRDTAKVRFVCMDCGNAWTSMKGQVAFWFQLQSCSGTVYFKLFGQKCKNCDSQYYEHAVWYPEEVVKVLKNISLEVSRRCYNVDSNYVRVNREKRLRPGCPRRPHSPSQCLACLEGICQAGALKRKQKLGTRNA